MVGNVPARFRWKGSPEVLLSALCSIAQPHLRLSRMSTHTGSCFPGRMETRFLDRLHCFLVSPDRSKLVESSHTLLGKPQEYDRVQIRVHRPQDIPPVDEETRVWQRRTSLKRDWKYMIRKFLTSMRSRLCASNCSNRFSRHAMPIIGSSRSWPSTGDEPMSWQHILPYARLRQAVRCLNEIIRPTLLEREETCPTNANAC